MVLGILAAWTIGAGSDQAPATASFLNPEPLNPRHLNIYGDFPGRPVAVRVPSLIAPTSSFQAGQ